MATPGKQPGSDCGDERSLVGVVLFLVGLVVDVVVVGLRPIVSSFKE